MGKRGLFITGTDTGVGKTYVAAMIARALVAAGHRVGVYKPVASGCRRQASDLLSDDAQILWEAAGRPGELARVCPQRFAAALAPHLAAHAEGRRIDEHMLRRGLDYWLERSDFTLVEGAGGLMSPLAGNLYNADLAAEFGFPLVVVARNALGTINHTLLTLIAVGTYAPRLQVAGIVLNDPDLRRDDASRATNLRELELRCAMRVLASIQHGATGCEAFDWFSLGHRAARAENAADHAAGSSPICDCK